MRKPSFHYKALLEPQLLLLLSIIIIITVILTMIFADRTKNFKKEYRFKFFLYVFSMMFVFALIAFMGTTRAIDDLLNEFVFYQCLIGILGVIHTILYRSYLDKFGNKPHPLFFDELLFLLIVSLYAFVSFIAFYTIFHSSTYSVLVSSCLIVFCIPTFIYALFSVATSIPAKVYHTWMMDKDYPEISDDEYRELIVVTLMFEKHQFALNRSEFKAKAPIRIDFGRMFYFFINDYNLRHPDEGISLFDVNGEAQNWVFYLKPKWYGTSKYIDPNLPLYMNGVEENSIIICERVAANLGKED